jgi:hypothetical protein
MTMSFSAAVDVADEAVRFGQRVRLASDCVMNASASLLLPHQTADRWRHRAHQDQHPTSVPTRRLRMLRRRIAPIS